MKFHCRVSLPGIDPKEVQIHAQGNMLTIRCERKVERRSSGRGRRWTQQSAFRSLTQTNGQPIVSGVRRGLEINAKSEISAWAQTQQHAVDGNLSENKYERSLTWKCERTSLSAAA